MSEPVFEVVVWDWRPPDNVIATFTDRESAKAHADRMDGLALRCYVRARDEAT